MPDKIKPLDSAVREHIASGDTVFVGGFGQCIPFAIAHEIVRQGTRDLTLCRSGADILFDLLIAAGAVKKVAFGYLGNPSLGLAHAFRRAAESGTLEVEDWTNFSMVLRLHAGALGVPFLPTRTLSGGDTPTRLGVKTVTCPYTGETFTAVPALVPDVAIIHAQRADRHGNVQLFGLTGDTVEGVNASRKVVATVEEIVDDDVVKAAPDRTIVPAFRVTSVSVVPWGAYPSYVHGRYGRDDAAYAAWDRIARKADVLDAWIAENIKAVPDYAATVAALDQNLLARLVSEAEAHYG